MFTIFLILLWVTIAVIGDMVFKGAALWSGRFWLGMLLYASTAFLAIPVLNAKQFGWVVVMWVASSLVISILTSIFYLGEPLTARRTLACLLILGAVILEGN